MKNGVDIEEWRPIAGYEGKYEVSSWGRVRSLKRTVPAGNHTRTVPETILAQRKRKNGYMQVTLYRNGKPKYVLVHRLVAAAFHERQSGLNLVDHRDHNRSNNHKDNLRWTTNRGNTENAIKAGRVKARSVCSSTGRFYAVMARAADDGFIPQDIWRCCQGLSKTHRGEEWHYANGMGDGIHG